MRRKWLEQEQKIAQDGGWLAFPTNRLVDKNHQGGNGGVETQAIQIFGHFFDTGLQCFELIGAGREVLNGRAELNFLQQRRPVLRFRREGLLECRFALFIHEQSPHPAEETVDPFHSFGAPRFDHLQRSHEHFVKAQ